MNSMAPDHGDILENHSHETSSNPNEEGCSHCESEECKTSATLEENSFSPRIETLSSVTSDDKLTCENHSHEASYNLNGEDNSYCDSEGCDTSTTLEEKSISPLLLEFSVILLWLYAIVSNNKLQLTLLTLTQQVKSLEWERKKNFGKICELQRQLRTCTFKRPLHMTLLRTDKDTKFFTGIDTKELFNALHDYIAPFVQRRWKGAKRVVKSVRQLGKKRGPERKLDSRDEFLLTLKKLRLGLLLNDLAHRFKISSTLCGQIFTCWIGAMAKVLSSMVYMPTQGVLNVTSPDRFNSVLKIHSIIDCSELFIETPQSHDLQAISWSTYKHHNTLKFLIGVAPNSSIIFISKAYTGRISDKEITIQTEYLDKVPPYSVIMCDKGFNINEECDARRITLYVPPGKRGMSQMGYVEISRTNRIAKLRILVEQVIGRLKCFRILSSELPVLMIPHTDNILIVCAALSNIKEPIFVD